MAGTRFPALAGLLSAVAIAGAPGSVRASEDGDDTTIELGAVENAMAIEVDKAAAAATAAANKRWNAVMTSDAGKKNPAAAARALNGSAMSSDDVIAMLDDMAPGTAEPEQKPDGAAGTSRARLGAAGKDNGDASVDTGGAQQSNKREGGLSAADHRTKTAAARNARTVQAAGGEGNVKSVGATGN